MTKPKRKDDIEQRLRHAQMHLVEKALVTFLEELLGRVPSDEEILAKGVWANFAPTPLSVFEKDTWRFSQFFIYDRTHAVAIGFPDPEDLLCLKFVELRPDEWPTALKLFIAKMEETREKGPEA